MSEHRELPSSEVHAPGYVQNTDPGTIGFKKLWIQTDDDVAPTAVLGIFIRDATDSAFINALTSVIGAVSSVFGRTGAVVAVAGDYDIDQLAGVVLTAPGAGEFFRFNGVDWVNTVLVAGDIPLLDAAKIASGVLNIARLATGTPNGSKFVRDDGTLAVPTGSVGSLDDLSDVVITAAAK